MPRKTTFLLLTPTRHNVSLFLSSQGQVRRLDDEYRRFTQIYEEIIIRLEKLESLLFDAERDLDVTRISVSERTPASSSARFLLLFVFPASPRRTA